MRRLVYGLLTVLVGFGAVQAKVHTNKTFLMPRDQIRNLGMQYSTWHRQVNKDLGNHFGASIHYRPFLFLAFLCHIYSFLSFN